jgi:dimethylamine/trimethylamine dehydrogenase
MTNEQPQVHRALAGSGVEVITLSRVVKFQLGELVIANLFTGEERRLSCRSLVIVGARKSREELFQALMARRQELVPAGILSVDRIGDALAPGAIAHAVHSGHRYARETDCPPGTELYRRDAPIVEDLPLLYDDGSGERETV